MIQRLWRWWSSQSSPEPSAADGGALPSAADQAAVDDTVVLYARVGPTPERSFPPATDVAARPGSADAAREDSGGSHRRSVLGRRLSDLHLCGPRRCRQLEAIGVLTARDLVTADLDHLAEQFEASRSARRALQTYRRAIRLAAAIPRMLPEEAHLLISIHRRSVVAVAVESPGLLYRDLERFAMSSRGKKRLRGRPLPGPERVRDWIEASAQQHALATQARSAPPAPV